MDLTSRAFTAVVLRSKIQVVIISGKRVLNAMAYACVRLHVCTLQHFVIVFIVNIDTVHKQCTVSNKKQHVSRTMINLDIHYSMTFGCYVIHVEHNEISLCLIFVHFRNQHTDLA